MQPCSNDCDMLLIVNNTSLVTIFRLIATANPTEGVLSTHVGAPPHATVSVEQRSMTN